MDNRPIGVFDSGLGGLTVLSKIIEEIPTESIVYFGDCGRTPYGVKSKETIVKFTFQDIKFLLNQDIKMVVIACNTVSSNSLHEVKKEFKGIHIVEVIEPGALSAVNETVNKKVGVIGTSGTINSNVYENAIKKLDDSITVYSKACPLFVPLVEEGWWDNDIALRTAEEYLLPLKEKGIDTLVLGCTHYPLIINEIKAVLPSHIKVINQGTIVAESLDNYLKRHNEIENQLGKNYNRSFYTTDTSEMFNDMAELFYGESIFSEHAEMEM